MIMNVNSNNNEDEPEIKVVDDNLVQYSIEKNEYDQEKNETFANKGQFDTGTLYIDGEDKKPKLMIIIGGIVLLLIIILVSAIACSKTGKKDSNNNLSSIKITNGEFLPEFSPNVLNYNVVTTRDIVNITCTTSSNKASVSGCNKRLSLDGNCTGHEVRVTSQNGAVKVYSLNICKQSSNAPVINDIKTNPDKYTNSKVTLTVELEDNTDLNGISYSFDGGKSWQEKNTYEVTKNATIKIQVKDKANNKSAILDKEITNIDNTIPNVTINGNVPSGNQSSSNVKLTSTILPGKTLSGYKYQWYKGTSAIGGATSSSYTASSSGTYKVKVTTGAGITKESNGYVVNIKATTNPTPTPTPSPKPTPKPSNATVTINGVTGNPSSWTSNNVTLTVNAYASEGLNNSAYSFDGGSTWQTSKSKTFAGNQTVKIVIRDVKGNKSSIKSVLIDKIDKNQPAITISGGSYVGDTLTIQTTPSSTPSGYRYQWYDKNMSAISGATNKTYVPKTPGTYYAKVYTGAGVSSVYTQKTVSTKVTASVSLSGIVGQNVLTNINVLISAKVVNGSAVSYSWYKDNVLQSTSSLSAYTATSKGTYKVVVITSEGYSITSNAYVVNKVNGPICYIYGPYTSAYGYTVDVNVKKGDIRYYQSLCTDPNGVKTYESFRGANADATYTSYSKSTTLTTWTEIYKVTVGSGNGVWALGIRNAYDNIGNVYHNTEATWVWGKQLQIKN